MQFSLNDNRTINAIITRLTNEDLDIIRKEVERLHSLKSFNPLFSAIADYNPSEFTPQAHDWLDMSDLDFQVMVSEFFWDALTFRVTREYAIGIFLDRDAREE